MKLKNLYSGAVLLPVGITAPTGDRQLLPGDVVSVTAAQYKKNVRYFEALKDRRILVPLSLWLKAQHGDVAAQASLEGLA